MPKIVRGTLEGRGLSFVIVVSRFNEEITERLIQGAREGLSLHGVSEDSIRMISVAGAVEIPLAAQAAIQSWKPDAVVALGAVIRGETSHYDVVCSMCANGCQEVSLKTGVPVAFGVITCENDEQALARTQPGPTNKGFEVAGVAIEMARLLEEVRA